MKISVITVTYNSAKYLPSCIESIQSQTYSDIEYIIVDGNSTDATIDIVKKYGVQKFMSEPDKGIYDAINKGIRMASGDIIGILNSDDVLSDETVLERIMLKFSEDTNLEAVYADVQYFDRENINNIVRNYSSGKFRPWMFRYGFQPAHPTFYARKELFEKYESYRTDMKIAGDFELLMRFLYIHKISYKYIAEVWVKMRIGGVSSSGFASLRIKTAEILKACRLNGIYTNRGMIYSKYLFKWWGFLIK